MPGIHTKAHGHFNTFIEFSKGHVLHQLQGIMDLISSALIKLFTRLQHLFPGLCHALSPSSPPYSFN
jgi:hypothetical protein